MHAAEVHCAEGFHFRRLPDGGVQLRVSTVGDELTFRRGRLSAQEWSDVVQALERQEASCPAT